MEMMKTSYKLLFFFCALLAAVCLGGIFLVVEDRRNPWLVPTIMDFRREKAPLDSEQPIHILFSFVDHFEPSSDADLQRWIEGYPAMTEGFLDADGYPPRHTWFWFFPPIGEEKTFEYLRELSELAYEGYGEVELHFHHENDTPETWREKMRWRLGISRSAGAMVTLEERPETKFAFIHGLWALDNSRLGEACGVDNELELLQETGCYADFTHPSWGPMQPHMVNCFYYASDDPSRPKSYDRGRVMSVGGQDNGEFLLMLGPSAWIRRGFRLFWDTCDITSFLPPTPERIDAWIRTGVHVRGRPEWVFVRLHTHGATARDHRSLLGPWARRMHAYLSASYNDGERYILHYVTAREAYNIAKAAEAGKTGNPAAYRDFVIPPPFNAKLVCSCPYEPLLAGDDEIGIEPLCGQGEPVSLRVRMDNVRILGSAKNISVHPLEDGCRVDLEPFGDRAIRLVEVPRNDQKE